MNRLERFGLPFFGVCIAAAVVITAWSTFVRTQPFDPISFELQEIQRVDDEGAISIPVVAGFDGPAVRTDQTVPTHAVVTIDSDTDVEFIGDVVWLSERPPGSECVERNDIPRILSPGVHAFDFENPIPDCVIDSLAIIGTSQWRITGTATPTAPGGVPAVWTSEPFWIVQ